MNLYQIIQSLSDDKRLLLEEKLYTNQPYPSQQKMTALAKVSNVFDFLRIKPYIYSLEHEESV